MDEKKRDNVEDILTRIEESPNFTLKQERFLRKYEDAKRIGGDRIDYVTKIASELLYRHFNYESQVLFNNELKDEAQNGSISKINLENILANQIVKTQDYIFYPMRGKNEIQKATGFPTNEKCVVGALKLKKKVQSKDIKFLLKYATAIGTSLHEGLLRDELYDQIEMKERVLDTITHDLRSPTASISAGTSLFRGFDKFDEATRKVILDNVDSAASEIEQTLKLCDMLNLSSNNLENNIDSKEICDLIEETI